MIERLTSSDLDGALDDLTGILHACVHDGASVGFILPFPPEQARAYWLNHVWSGVAGNELDLFAVRNAQHVLGTVQLIPAKMPNQPHRADVAKLLVHPNARRQGLGRALMAALEERAAQLGRNVLVLDTRSSDPSLRLYQSLGFQIAGEIPNYCRNPFDDRLEPTTFMYKNLH
ncbi:MULTISPECIES: N-acetyltransferase [unclassified Ruegeria]|uniref:GNAT family N-acetyltransferase n=1 Tax=unclassified Ruegeria TaxID=2625375 RepID=UPI001ADC75D1|nr:MULTISPECIES: N-acetyltransferase [unclassified Ruegeria]MBO9411928.1 GNAT family N-acetyltransferase [Ruegeria sp. R8_1]MBO9417037.1 GNAT family N-acetyltransferase [Ruegeria sp. R8_2]